MVAVSKRPAFKGLLDRLKPWSHGHIMSHPLRFAEDLGPGPYDFNAVSAAGADGGDLQWLAVEIISDYSKPRKML